MYYIQLLSKIIQEGQEIDSWYGKSKELLHQQLEVPSACFYSFDKIRSLEKILDYWMNELAWFMSGDRTNIISKHASLWSRIQNPDGSLNSNYGFLVFYNKTNHPSLSSNNIEILTPFDWAYSNLNQDPSSRKAIITYNTGGFNFLNNKDYICTQHQAFFIRDNKLYCFIALRSSDAIYGLTYNMPWWQIVYQQLYLQLLSKYPRLKSTPILVTIYSAHIYQKHYKLVDAMITVRPDIYKLQLKDIIPLGKDFNWYYRNLHHFISITERVKNALL